MAQGRSVGFAFGVSLDDRAPAADESLFLPSSYRSITGGCDPCVWDGVASIVGGVVVTRLADPQEGTALRARTRRLARSGLKRKMFGEGRLPVVGIARIIDTP
jgi:hypothetical protein